jgi:hypothetical protein
MGVSVMNLDFCLFFEWCAGLKVKQLNFWILEIEIDFLGQFVSLDWIVKN